MWKPNPYNYSRRPTNRVKIGKLLLGGENPIRVQSMANTDTNDVKGSVEQYFRIVNAGGELVRFTVQGMKEAESVKQIHTEIKEKSDVPLVADIHFNSKIANITAEFLEKVRINPGNFVGNTRKTDYTEQEYKEEFEKIKIRFTQLIGICKKKQTALRIGVNHGSLSERMMNRWGNSPEGMVESCMEFLEICQDEEFHDVVISMKSSNTVLMMQAVRLLVQRMERIGYKYPIHLGVTEAGDGEDGRIKSAVGIGGLLADGIGDTIRVSLSEEPECEIPVARKLVEYVQNRQNHDSIEPCLVEDIDIKPFVKRETYKIENIGGDTVPVVLSKTKNIFGFQADYYFISNDLIKSNEGKEYRVITKESLQKVNEEMIFLRLKYDDLDNSLIDFLKSKENVVIVFENQHVNPIGEMRAFAHRLIAQKCRTPILLMKSYSEKDLETFQIKSATDFGVLFVDGLIDGICLINQFEEVTNKDVVSTAFGILQASRKRTTKTEFISCPGCGRTLFRLQDVISRVKNRTSHLKGLKIGIMGCIVNGPGEMADADYGYVGAGKGKISLYKKQECIKRNVPEKQAVEELIKLIQVNGDWVEPQN